MSGAVAEVEGANTLYGVKFVAAEGGRVDVEGAEINRNLADGLNGVGVQERASRVNAGGDFAHGVDHAGFVVGQHEGDERRLRGEGGGERGFIERAVGADWQQVDAVALSGETFAPTEDGRVFDGTEEYVAAAGAGVEGGADGEGVAFGAAAGEDDGAVGDAEQRGDFGAGSGEGQGGGAGPGVGTGGIAEVDAQVRQQGVDDFRSDGRGGVVVEVVRHGQCFKRRSVSRRTSVRWSC